MSDERARRLQFLLTLQQQRNDMARFQTALAEITGVEGGFALYDLEAANRLREWLLHRLNARRQDGTLDCREYEHASDMQQDVRAALSAPNHPNVLVFENWPHMGAVWMSARDFVESCIGLLKFDFDGLLVYSVETGLVVALELFLDHDCPPFEFVWTQLAPGGPQGSD